MKVAIFVHTPGGDYKIDWNKTKDAFPRVSVDSFVEIGSGKYPNLSWNFNLEVEDETKELLDVIFVVVSVDGVFFSERTWTNHYGGSSWYVKKAFSKKENAESYIKNRDEEWERFWVVPVNRYKGGK